jgi:hypothetical protein
LLDLLERARFPKATLDSHYRSLRPGAIELANSTFYDNRLKIFPSAEVGAAAKGLSFNFVSNGVYRSQVSTNVKEGSAVVEAIVSHIHSSPSLSLGVVTFNDQQRDLIDRLLEQKRSDDPVIDRFFSNHPHEELFIKNIENVQGDERDVIFVSIGYGHDSEGHFSMNFGPINQPDGPNRINTMMTRYKSQMTIFASFEPNDPAFDRTNARGIKILQKLLKIANGYIEQEIHEQRAVLDPFQLAIAEFLTNKGYTVHANIGPSGSGVNLAVVNPNDTGKYLLGILTDGEDYQSIAGASDRERIKIRALLDRGWNIHRAWCLDWFNNPETARKNLFGLLKSIASAEGAPVLIGGDSAPRRRPKVLRKQRQPLVASFTYKKAELNPDEFLVRYRESDRVRAASECGKIIDKIVRTEGPIHEQNILRRVCEVAGLSRNEKSKAIFSEAFKNWKEQRNAEEHNGFFTSGEITIVPRDRSQLHDEEREANDVDSRELQALINKVVRYSFGIKTEELCAIVNTSLGIRRTSFDELKIRTIDMLEKAIGLGEFREENGVIRVA